MKSKIILLLVVMIACINAACKKKKKENPDAEFDRAALLTNVRDNIILPQYGDFVSRLSELQTAATSFTSSANITSLENLQTKFKNAYLAWQKVSAFEFGPAEQSILRMNMNSFPTDTNQIRSNINSGSYNLNAASNIRAKGFPALDYLLFSKPVNAILDSFTISSKSTNRKNLLNNIIADMLSNAQTVNNKWNNEYKNTFTSNTGTDIGSSISLLVNQLSFECEMVRRERIGNALGYQGIVNTNITNPWLVEAYYSNYSKPLILENLHNLKNIYSGKNGQGFDDYLNHINADYNGQPLANVIMNQFDIAINAVNQITPDLKTALHNNKPSVDAAFLEVKKLVVLIKIDMTSQLGLIISYQDGDGD
ncbi:MAG: imelysin family protein [Cytophagaceae bacterium]|nr:imelysin family protein [Cytophagaceae bacterium]MDW8456419.1 imelysin family protein [Cytophagaceae bacterium]